MADTSAPIRVAIIGGGLAGATLANALFKLDHLSVHVYESAPEFSERGAAVGLAVNSQAALNQILPDADEMLDRAGAVLMNSTRTMIGSGPAAGTLVFDLAGMDPGKVVHRASLLKELLAPLPKDTLHASKKLVSISESESDKSQMTLKFDDDVVEDFHAVIGADGIFGFVRKHVLGDAASECTATPAGFWDTRTLVPIEKAKNLLGEQWFQEDRQYGWMGNGAFILHDVLDGGSKVQCIISALEKEPSEDRKREVTRDCAEEILKDWLDGPIAKGILDVTFEDGFTTGYSQWQHTKTLYYNRGNVCIMGDAAHATTPWQGSGAGMAIEDAMILGTLLAQVKRPVDLKAAFQAYDEVRRPRCQQVIDSSKGSGLIMCGHGPDIGVDAQKMAEALGPRWGFIFGLDMRAHKEEALVALQRSLSK